MFDSLVIQDSKPMNDIILSSVTCRVQPYFFTWSHQRHDFREKATGHKMCVL